MKDFIISIFFATLLIFIFFFLFSAPISSGLFIGIIITVVSFILFFLIKHPKTKRVILIFLYTGIIMLLSTFVTIIVATSRM